MGRFLFYPHPPSLKLDAFKSLLFSLRVVAVFLCFMMRALPSSNCTIESQYRAQGSALASTLTRQRSDLMWKSRQGGITHKKSLLDLKNIPVFSKRAGLFFRLLHPSMSNLRARQGAQIKGTKGGLPHSQRSLNQSLEQHIKLNQRRKEIYVLHGFTRQPGQTAFWSGSRRTRPLPKGLKLCPKQSQGVIPEWSGFGSQSKVKKQNKGALNTLVH